MPAKRKADTQPRSSTANRPALDLAPAVGDVEHLIPPPPDGLRDEAIEVWEQVWLEPQARAFTRADHVVLERYVVAYDEWVGAMAAVSVAPLVTGSTGQMVGNPLMKWVASREAEMERCERQLGIGLRNRADLGIALGEAKLTAAEVNKMAKEGRRGDSSSQGARPKKISAEEREQLEIIEGFVIEE